MDKKSILKILFLPLTPFNKIIKKNSRRILFYSNLGFRDNIKSMYDYLIANGYNEKYQIICSLDDYTKYTDTAPKNVKFVSNLSGLRYFFTSKFMFYSFGKYPVKPSKKQCVVNLWHGMPLKTIGNLCQDCEKTDYFFFTYTIATSEFFRDIMAKSFSCPKKNVLCVGQPRCDVLAAADSTSEKKLILWMPTYRTSDALGSDNAGFHSTHSFPLIDTDEQLERLNSLLKGADKSLIIKPHPLQNITEQFHSYSNIHLKTQADFDMEKTDIYSLFKDSAGLITDYSSVYFDYLLVDRPIGFTLDDLQEYSDARGFTVDNPQELMCGEKIRTFEDLYGFVENICKGNDTYAQERHKVNALVNSHQTGCSSKTILNIIGLSK